jgi:hypothetical protein
MNPHMHLAVVQSLETDMRDFGISPIELVERITVLMDTDHFNFKEDSSVWLQKRGKSPWVCEVYFDETWCCDLYESDSKDKLRNKFFKGFLKGYNKGKIRLNKQKALLEDEIAEAKKQSDERDLKKKIADLPTSTPDEKMAKDIIKEIHEEKDAQPISD